MAAATRGDRTAHLFRVMPADGAKQIKVEFTNRFGEVYTQSIGPVNGPLPPRTTVHRKGCCIKIDILTQQPPTKPDTSHSTPFLPHPTDGHHRRHREDEADGGACPASS